MTSREVAMMFGVDPKTVVRWAGDGHIQCIRTPGGQLRFRQSDVERLRQ
jgi:excisionase family DNA binding protein